MPVKNLAHYPRGRQHVGATKRRENDLGRGLQSGQRETLIPPVEGVAPRLADLHLSGGGGIAK